MNTHMNMTKLLALAIIVAMTLSIGGILTPPTAHAGTVGTITASDTTINTDKLVQITVSDPDIAGSTVGMPSITSSRTVKVLNSSASAATLATWAAASPTQPGGLVPTYQAVGGSWVGFVGLYEYINGTGTRGYNIPRNPPAQDPTIATAKTNIAVTGTVGFGAVTAEPAYVTAVINQTSVTSLVTKLTASIATGSTWTISYNDADPPTTVSVTLTRGTYDSSVALDRTSYPPGASVYITITDLDRNFDPTSASPGQDSTAIGLAPDQINVTKILPSTDPAFPSSGYNASLSPAFAGGIVRGANVNLTETGANTGTFGQLAAALTIASTTPSGTVLNVVYEDAANAAGVTTNVTASALISTVTGTATLDKSTYSAPDTATITLTDPDLNLDSAAIEFSSAVGSTGWTTTPTGISPAAGGVVVNASWTGSVGFGIQLTETGKNTGVFTNTFFFSLTATTAATRTLGLNSSNYVQIWYNDAPTGTAAAKVASAKFVTNTGTISLDKASYAPGSRATVTVVDPDVNRNPNVIERAPAASGITTSSTAQATHRTAPFSSRAGNVTVTSSTDSTGALVLMKETGANTNTFTGTFDFATSGSTILADTPTIRTASGEVVTVRYADGANEFGSGQNVTTTATFGTHSGTLTTDRDTYPAPYRTGVLGGKIYITVTDPDLNTRSAQVEDTGSAVTVTELSTTAKYTATPVLTETGANTGIFEGNYRVPIAGARGDNIRIRYVDAADAAGSPNINVDKTVSLVTTSGTVSLDKSTYSLGNTPTVTVTDPDLNYDSKSVDTINRTTASAGFATVARTVYVYTTTTGTGGAYQMALTETGANTGVFTGTFTFQEGHTTTGTARGSAAGDSPRLLAKRGDTVTVAYRDAINAANAAATLTATATVLATTGSISLDKTAYHETARVDITVVDADMNVDTTIANIIPAAQVEITTTTTPTAITLQLTETGVDTNTFTNFIILDTTIATAPGDTLVVKYIDYTNAEGLRDTPVSTSATVKQFDGTVSLDKATYPLTDTATITVEDPDLNTQPTVADSFSDRVIASSTTDPAGLFITIGETGANTGIFTATITFKTTGASSGTTLLAKDGDTLTVTYRDRNPDIPATEAAPTYIERKTTAALGVVLEKPAETSGAKTLDATGAEKTSFAAGETVLPTATVKNVGTTAKFLVAIQVIAPDGTVLPSQFITVTLDASKDFTFSPGVVLPADAQTGTWTFEVSVFSDFPAQGGVVKGDPVTQTFTVA